MKTLIDGYLDQPFFTSPERISLDRNDFRPPAPGKVGLHDGARSLARRHPLTDRRMLATAVLPAPVLRRLLGLGA